MFYRLIKVGCGVLCLTVTVSAQSLPELLETLQPGSTSAQKSAPREVELIPDASVIVTTTGALIEGNLQHSQGGYLVPRGGGFLLIPNNAIKLTATSRHDAYLKYRKLMPEQTPGNHTTLARWCIQYQLISDARTELEAALELDSQSREAIALLRAIERPAVPQPMIQKKSNSFVREDQKLRTTSVYGLSPETVREYASAIQPILMNNCANSGCHATKGDNEFKLHYVRRTGYANRLASEKNLAQVLQQINHQSPPQSPLLTKAADHHAGPRYALKNNRFGKEMLARLDEWVEQVSQEAPPQQASYETSTSTQSSPELVPTKPKEISPIDTQTPAVDPFDPARFNRGAIR